MTSTDLSQIIKQIESLPLGDQLEIIAHLAEKARQQYLTAPSRHHWREIRGIASYPLFGEDAQSWVSRTRREGDALREQQWERKS